MATIDNTAVVSEFLARYTNEGQTIKDIKKQIFQASVTENFFSIRPYDNDHYRSVYASLDEVLAAFSVPFVKKGSLVFKPWEQKLGEFKIDDEMIPDRFRASWLGFLANLEEVDRSKWPIITWYIRQMLIPSTQRDMEEKVAYWGWQVTGYDADPMTRTVDGATFTRELESEDSVHPANAAMDGIRTQIIKMVDKSRANVIATGALSTDPATFCGQVEDYVAAIPRTHRGLMDFLFMSEDNANLYMDGVRAKYNTYWKQEDDLKGIKNSKIKIQALPSMDESDKIWCTPPMNRTRPVKGDKNNGKFDVQKADRAVKLLTDWKKLLTLDVPELVYTNDLENAITAADITAHYS